MSHIISTKLTTWEDVLDMFTYGAKVLVALDRSGSQPMADINYFLSRFKQNASHIRDVDIVEWDVNVTSPVPLYSYGQTLTPGGTDPTRLIHLINDSNYNRVVIHTDGFFCNVNIECKTELLFVLNEEGMSVKEFDEMWNTDRVNKASIVKVTNEQRSTDHVRQDHLESSDSSD